MPYLQPSLSPIRLAGRAWMGLLILSGLCLSARPGVAADRIYISYNLLERSVPVASLEAYARTGEIDEDLDVYAQYAKPQELQQLRGALLQRVDLSPVAVSQFLYSPQGEILLQRLGQVIQSESRVPGFNAIRAALILAAADKEGLTLLNVLRKFPTRGIRVDVAGSLTIAGALEKIIGQTNRATIAVTQQAVLEGLALPIALTAELRLRGPVSWSKQTRSLVDLARRPFIGSNIAVPGAPFQPVPGGRLIPVDIYLPNSGENVPVIVISHGLGGDRSTFAYLAAHLASYGFAVLVPEHPGSNAQQLQALINGTASEVAEPAEFVDRPLDISFVLDQLERDSAFQGRMNFQQVGVVGQSFGGYTALALGGATLNAEQLRQDCRSLNGTLNLSLLLQCDAAQLVQTDTKLQDKRIKAAIAINPITSAVFGQAGISQVSVPTMIMAGSADTVAPALPEQILPFVWLTPADKYLVVMDRGTHFSTIAGPTGTPTPGDALPLPNEALGPNPAIARRYVDALSTAFFLTHLANQPAYRSYLTAAYAQSISEAAMPLIQVRSLTTNQLAQEVREAPVTTTR